MIEIHKNGVNATYKEVSYYGIDYDSKKVLFSSARSIEEAIEKAKVLGYKQGEIQRMF